MATVAIEETAYDALEANAEDALRWVNEELILGIPAFYDDAVDTWLVFDHRLTLTQVAWWGCLLLNSKKVAKTWVAPKKEDSDDIDRVACAAEVQAMIADYIVLPQDIDYTDVENVWQVTLDAQGVGTDVMQGFGNVPAEWTPVEVV